MRQSELKKPLSKKKIWGGGAEGSRTPDLLIANETLYQLSYDPDQKLANYARVRADCKEFSGSAIIPLIFPRNQQNFGLGNAMNPDQPTETHSEPPAEKPAATPQSDNRRRHSRGGRGRFKRDGRGPRGERAERDPRREPQRVDDGHAQGHSHAPAHHHTKPAGSIGRALDQVDHIRSELQKVLEEIEEVMQTLEQAEREKTATEEEIEILGEQLRRLQRDTGHSRTPRFTPAPRPASPPPPKAAEDPEPSEPEPPAEED
jgi:hypothetical protein